jgi:hypothetical protein
VPALELGVAFAESLDRLAGAVARSAEAEYARVEPNPAGELQPSFVILTARVAELIEVAGDAAGDLANGYLLALADEAGVAVQTAGAPRSDPFQRSAGEVLGSIPGKVYLALSQGMALEEALPIGGAAIRSVAETWTRDAARLAIAASVESSDAVKGWRWWSRGTCGACLAFDTGSTYTGPMRAHPNCQCIPEPVIAGIGGLLAALRLTGPERFEEMTEAEQDEALGPELAKLLRADRVAWKRLRRRDPLGRAEEPDVSDLV